MSGPNSTPLFKKASVLALAISGTLILGYLLVHGAILFVGGWHKDPPASTLKALSPETQKLVQAALAEIPESGWLDYHAHVIGTGHGDTGAWVNPLMLSPLEPKRYLRLHVFRTGAGVRDLDQADTEYIERLKALIRSAPGKSRHVLLPFDAHHGKEGQKELEHSDFFVPNEYVFSLAEKNSDLFIPALSVHPYREDALSELRRWSERGGKIVKWLPNAMGIDPADPKCDPYYKAMKELGLTLLSHAGEERAVESSHQQELGNPLRLRRALDHGVQVIVAHCAGLGEGIDMDHPDRPMVSNFDLFLRLLEDEKYKGRLFGDISAMTLISRCGRPLRTLLERPELHPFLVYGSDYPVPAVDLLVQTRKLVSEGYISQAEAEAIDEIFAVNPLFYDFVLKRTLRAPESGKGFSTEIFYRDIL